jgi:hypothetical protein
MVDSEKISKWHCEKGMTGTAKDIKKGLKEFREKHKDKNYNEYVNMYNENKKETIESDEISQGPKCKCITDTINNKETFESKITKYLETLKNQSKIKLDYRTVELDTMDVEELKQLHDQEIKEKDKEIVELKKEIKELQAGIKLLKENKDWDFKTIKRK